MGRTGRRGGRKASGRGRGWWGGVGGWIGRSPLWHHTFHTTPALQLDRLQAATEPPLSPGRVCAGGQDLGLGGERENLDGRDYVGSFCTPPPLHPYVQEILEHGESLCTPEREGTQLPCHDLLQLPSCSEKAQGEGLGSKIL